MRTQNIPFSILKKKITLNYPKSAVIGFFSKRQFEMAVVNRPSVFEPLKFYCVQNVFIFFKRGLANFDQDWWFFV